MRAPRNVKKGSAWRRRAAHARDLVVVAYDETRVRVLRALSPRRRRRDRLRHAVLLGVLADNATPAASPALRRDDRPEERIGEQPYRGDVI
ncbi:hypothetical protein AB0R12_09680, partial [Streptomyces niveus]|uniref:hypothetical protein n=1 Tax=Streptomyces niveus TaxID=193462 RepID=UPI00343F7A3A